MTSLLPVAQHSTPTQSAVAQPARQQPRAAESALRRVLAGGGGLFRGNDYPRRLAEAAAGTQAPVLTGRRIAVLGSRGGAGKTTVCALLARIYAAMRADAVAAIDATPAAGTLGLRLGVPGAPPLDAAAARLESAAPASLTELASLLAVGTPANLLVAGRRQPVRAVPVSLPGGDSPDGAALRLTRVLSRYCPITVFDCGSGMDPSARWALDECHLAVFVTPASTAGVEDAAEYATSWGQGPGRTGVPLLVLVTPSPADSVSVRTTVNRSIGPAVSSPAREAAFLHRSGIQALPLGYDRHLADGAEIRPGLLAGRTRLDALALAARVLSLSTAGAAPACMPAAGGGTGLRQRRNGIR